MGAAFFDAKQWEMDESEAKKIAAAIADVQEHYDAVLDPRAQAWFNLISLIAMAYGPRVYITYQMSKKPKAKEQPSKPASVSSPPKEKPKEKSDPALSTPSALYGADFAKG